MMKDNSKIRNFFICIDNDDAGHVETAQRYWENGGDIGLLFKLRKDLWSLGHRKNIAVVQQHFFVTSVFFCAVISEND